MNKNTKGALAASAAAVLLLGGAGSLAYWNDVASFGSGTISSGELKLDASNCTSAGWTVTHSVGGATSSFVQGTDKIVPGDTLTKTCNVVVTAVGKNLVANLGATGPVANASSTMASGAYSLTSTFTKGGAALSTVTSADANKTIVATLTLNFPLGGTADNSSQLKNIDLSAVTVTATQKTV